MLLIEQGAKTDDNLNLLHLAEKFKFCLHNVNYSNDDFNHIYLGEIKMFY